MIGKRLPASPSSKPLYAQTLSPSFDGVNALVYEENYNYMDDLRTQKKRMFQPVNARSDVSVFGSSHGKVSTDILMSPFARNSTLQHSKQTFSTAKNDKFTPMSGNWSNRKSEPSLLDPAGFRVPRDIDKK